ncbi:MAG: dihydrodipicolinate synthase family protein [Pseudomonadota bacterium]
MARLPHWQNHPDSLTSHPEARAKPGGGDDLVRFGLSTALLTPFRQDGEIDVHRLGAHATTCLDQGADSVTLFGTTGEGASIGLEERRLGIEALLDAGCPPSKIVLGICATSVGDAVRQVAEGQAHGITAFLLLPPFYFRSPSEAGLFNWHAAVLARTDRRARFVLYHIPQVSGVALSPDLVQRITATAPQRVIAVKDSSGNWETAKALLALGAPTVLVGDERLLHRAVALGAGGAISGMANLHPGRLKRIVTTGLEDTALSAEVTRIASVPVIPAIKASLAAQTGDMDWTRLRPPLEPLSDEARAVLFASDATVT